MHAGLFKCLIVCKHILYFKMRLLQNKNCQLLIFNLIRNEKIGNGKIIRSMIF